MASQSEARADSQEQHTSGETVHFQTNSQQQPEAIQSSVDGESILPNKYATYETDSDVSEYFDMRSLASHDEEHLHGNDDWDISSVSQSYYMSAEEEGGSQENPYPSLEDIYPANLDLTRYEESHIGDEDLDTVYYSLESEIEYEEIAFELNAYGVPVIPKDSPYRTRPISEDNMTPNHPLPLTGHINPGWGKVCGVDQDGHSVVCQNDSDSYYLRKAIEGGEDWRPGSKCKWQKVPRSRKEVRMPSNIPRTKIHNSETGKEQESPLVPELMLTTPEGGSVRWLILPIMVPRLDADGQTRTTRTRMIFTIRSVRIELE
ncbi:hypothetical protein V8F06_009561 [Rhypophila decipiens]